MTTALSQQLEESGFDCVPLFGMQIARVTIARAVETLLAWCRAPRGEACRYVVTPNLDHVVLFHRDATFRAAYADAALVLADGAPLVAASRLFRRALPERVAGSDLVPKLFAAAEKPLRVFLLGAAPGVASKAAERIEKEWPNAAVVGAHSPPLGFENVAAENERIFEMMREASPDVVIIGLGAPRQERWVHAHCHELPAKVAICGGATIDFLAGEKRRSPMWMRHCGLEWVHRVWSEPRRLAGRYARDAWAFPKLLWREWRGANE